MGRKASRVLSASTPGLNAYQYSSRISQCQAGAATQKEPATRAGEVVVRGRPLGTKATGRPFAKVRFMPAGAVVRAENAYAMPNEAFVEEPIPVVPGLATFVLPE